MLNTLHRPLSPTTSPPGLPPVALTAPRNSTFRPRPQASKVPSCAKMAQQAMEQGMAVVIGLQSTGGGVAGWGAATALLE